MASSLAVVRKQDDRPEWKTTTVELHNSTYDDLIYLRFLTRKPFADIIDQAVRDLSDRHLTDKNIERFFEQDKPINIHHMQEVGK